MAHQFSLIRVSTLAVMIAGFGYFSTPANAGFEWKPSPKAGTAITAPAATPDMPPLPPMPSEQVDSNVLMQMPTPPLPSLPSPPDLAHDAPAHAMPPVMPVTSPSRAANALPEAIGFGSDLPLALGMRQIVPAQYAYSFAPGIDQGAKISWNGGKPWNESLNDALKPLGYKAIVDGTTVRVLSGDAAAPAPVVAASVETIEPAFSAPVAPPMALRAGGDMPRPPLSPAEAPASVSVANPEAKAVHEVYVRRNPAAPDSAPKAPAKSEVVSDKKEVAPSNEGEKSGFWNRVNPMNWQKDADNKPSPYMINRTAGEVSTAKETPPPPSYGAMTDAAPMARMSDNDARVDATKEPIGAKARVPHGPDDVADVVAQPETAAPNSGPVLLTRGPGEVVAAPAPAAGKDSVFSNNAAPSAINNASVASWEAKQGDSLKAILQTWSEQAQVQLYWVPAQDYKLPKAIHVQGNYTDAVADALGAYGDKGARPVGRLHPNLPNGPSVLIIEPASS